MDHKKKESSILNLLLPIGLQSFFAMAALLLCVAGGLLYKNIQAQNDINFESSTAAGYISNKLQQVEPNGFVEIREAESTSILVIRETFSGEVYETRIFCDGAFLREEFTHEDTPFALTNGNEIVQANTVTFAKSEAGLVRASIVSQNEEEIHISLYFPEGGAG